MPVAAPAAAAGLGAELGEQVGERSGAIGCDTRLVERQERRLRRLDLALYPGRDDPHFVAHDRYRRASQRSDRAILGPIVLRPWRNLTRGRSFLRECGARSDDEGKQKQGTQRQISSKWSGFRSLPCGNR